MIKDLKSANALKTRIDAKVCVIGAGTAGIYLAQQLRKSGVHVVLLEAGGEDPNTPENADQHCIQKGIRYRGADLGRSFGLGGTSVLWGGQLIALTPSDIVERPGVGLAAWPVSFSDIAAYFPSVRQQLGLPFDPSDEDSVVLRSNYPLLSNLDIDEFNLRLSTWLPFRKRNFRNSFEVELRSDRDLEVWINAPVTKFIQSDGNDESSILAVRGKSINGNVIEVHSDIFVICAGALESTRLMLDLDERSGGRITREGAPLGRYFSDHLSVTCGHLECRSWQRYNMEVAPMFYSSIMRTPRIELSSTAQNRLAMTSAFAHFTFLTHGNTGIDLVRNVLRRQQTAGSGEKFSLKNIKQLVTDLSAIAYWRWRHKRLWIPRSAELLLQVDIEQTPNRESRLMLSDERDSLDRKRLVIDWRISKEDSNIISTMAERMDKAWNKSQLKDIANLNLAIPESYSNYDSLYDVYHPTGTLRMGSSAGNSVVNADLKLWAFKNCYISSTAVFPSAGSANPGLMHLALTSRLAEHLVRKV